MKTVKFILAAATIIFLLSPRDYCQDTLNTNDEGSFYINAGAGVTTFSLGKIDDLYNNIIDAYRGLGFPLIIQRQNPGNIIFNISLAKEFSSLISGGLKFQHTWTSSYALYSDAIGNLDITSKMKMTMFYGFVTLNLGNKFSVLRPSIMFSIGGLNADYNLTRVSSLTDRGNYSSESKFYFSKMIPAVELQFLLKYKAGIADIIGMAGYRYSKTTEVEAYASTNGNLTDQGSTDLEVNLSGFSLILGLELEL